MGSPLPERPRSTGSPGTSPSSRASADDLVRARRARASRGAELLPISKSELQRAGFDVESGVAGLPTAFVASYGRGGPIVGIVALLDALPGRDGAWHGCGHNLIGAADLGAAIAVKEALASNGLPGHHSLLRRARRGDLSRRGLHGARRPLRRSRRAPLLASVLVNPRHRPKRPRAWTPFATSFTGGPPTRPMRKTRVETRSTPPTSSRAAPARGWPEGAVVNHVILEGGELPSVVPERATTWYFLHGRDRAVVESLRGRMASLAARLRDPDRDRGRRAAPVLDRPVAHQPRARRAAAAKPRRRPPALLQRRARTHQRRHRRSELGRAARRLSRPGVRRGHGVPQPGVERDRDLGPRPTRDDPGRSRDRIERRGALDRRRLLRVVRKEFESATAGRSYVSPLPAGKGPFDHLPRPH